MPIYEYQCSDCGKEFEKLVRFSDPNLNSPECPNCQSDNTRKRMSAIAAISSGRSSASSASNCSSTGPFR